MRNFEAYFYFFVLIFLGISFGQNHPIELHKVLPNKTTFIIDKPIGYMANNIRNKALKYDKKIKTVKNIYEIYFLGDSISVMVIQTEKDKFYIDKNLDNYISIADSFHFDDSKPLNIAQIKLDTEFPDISNIKLITIHGKDFILLKIAEKFKGELILNGKTIPVFMYLNLSYFKYLNENDRYTISIDIDNNKIIEPNEMTKLNQPIMIDGTPIVFDNFKIHRNKIVLFYKKSDQMYSNAEGFYHPNIKIFSLKDSSKIELQDLIKNKIAIINWWSPSCVPCRMEMPELNHLVEKYKNNSEIVFIALNFNSHQNKVIKFLEKNKFNFKQYFVSNETAKELNINLIPKTLVIDQTGKIIYEQSGYNKNVKLKKLKEIIKSLL